MIFKKLKPILVSSLALMLTACATPPQFVSSYFNAQDPCQIQNKPAGYQRPDFCGAGMYARSRDSQTRRTTQAIYDVNGRVVGYVR